MIPRYPKIDVEQAPIIWSTIPEFSHIINGLSIGAPVVEPYLNDVMRKARQLTKERDTPLRDDIDLFIKQESNHFRMHMKFNRILYEAGYNALKPIELKLKRELTKMLNKRSLAFNLAYCAGFENFTMYTAKFMFEKAGKLFEGADPRGANLILWHMAEEFEHRCVCHDVFARFSGNYFLRIFGLVYSYFHLNGFIGAATAAIMSHYRKDMTQTEIRSSIKQQEKINRKIFFWTLPRMLAILIPYYDPRKYRPPPRITEALKYYEGLSTKAA